MINYQSLFDGIVSLLEKNARNHVVAKQCLADCDLELSFTPAKKNTPVSKTVLLDIFKRTDDKAYNQLKDSFNNTTYTDVIIWYIDTEKGGYTVFTDVDSTEIIGIKTSTKTLHDIREGYFKQKETLEKINEKPLFNYGDNEITFINKQLVK